MKTMTFHIHLLSSGLLVLNSDPLVPSPLGPGIAEFRGPLLTRLATSCGLVMVISGILEVAL